jgi:hypothetical protein
MYLDAMSKYIIKKIYLQKVGEENTRKHSEARGYKEVANGLLAANLHFFNYSKTTSVLYLRSSKLVHQI